jgi:hypothetical protein
MSKSAPVGDSWESFAAALGDESAALSRLAEAAQALTKALIDGKAQSISTTQASLDTARKAFASASARRRAMQARGFGKMTLRQVCAYAPRRMRPVFNQRLYELTTNSIGMRITNNNNRALIAKGMERLMSVTSALQRAANQGPKTYRRRGFIPPPTNSVLVSSRV